MRMHAPERGARCLAAVLRKQHPWNVSKYAIAGALLLSFLVVSHSVNDPHMSLRIHHDMSKEAYYMSKEAHWLKDKKGASIPAHVLSQSCLRLRGGFVEEREERWGPEGLFETAAARAAKQVHT